MTFHGLDFCHSRNSTMFHHNPFIPKGRLGRPRGIGHFGSLGRTLSPQPTGGAGRAACPTPRGDGFLTVVAWNVGARCGGDSATRGTWGCRNHWQLQKVGLRMLRMLRMLRWRAPCDITHRCAHQSGGIDQHKDLVGLLGHHWHLAQIRWCHGAPDLGTVGNFKLA